ncbi:MAG: DUF177 domain-containing protein [Lachnospiraceae bacterium]|jgi:uncharacterized protein|nr:DUF177 domain-containing protein [Lachnospiraceae bacterium]
MLINLSDVLTSEGMQISRELPLEMTCFESRMGSFPIIASSPVSLRIRNAGAGKAKLDGGLKLTLQAGCDRCLTEVPVALDLQFDRTVVSGTEDVDADELGLTEDCQLDVETFVHNEILVNWPGKILCREDCRGICPVCGQDLNERECGCDTFVPDPRMAVIQDIFNKNKEV